MTSCGTIIFIESTPLFELKFVYNIENTSTEIAEYKITTSVSYPCGWDCNKESCVWWKTDGCKKKIWGICYDYKWVCAEYACTDLKAIKWCTESETVTLWPTVKVGMRDSVKLKIFAYTTHEYTDLKLTLKDLTKLGFKFKSGELYAKIEDDLVSVYNMENLPTMYIIENGSIEIEFNAWHTVFVWQGISSTLTFFVSLLLCPIELTIAIKLKVKIECSYDTVTYSAKVTVQCPVVVF